MTIIYLINHSTSKLINEVCSCYFSAFYSKKGYWEIFATLEQLNIFISGSSG